MYGWTPIYDKKLVPNTIRKWKVFFFYDQWIYWDCKKFLSVSVALQSQLFENWYTYQNHKKEVLKFLWFYDDNKKVSYETCLYFIIFFFFSYFQSIFPVFQPMSRLAAHSIYPISSQCNTEVKVSSVDRLLAVLSVILFYFFITATYSAHGNKKSIRLAWNFTFDCVKNTHIQRYISGFFILYFLLQTPRW